MKVLVVGGGGREHALARSLARSADVRELLAAPGNPGIAAHARCVDVAANDVVSIARLVEDEDVDLTVVGPEAPLVAGLVDTLASRGRLAFGPTRGAARIEGSKAWAKALCERHGIPCGRSRPATTTREALDALDELGPPYVVKADGLAAGKGVVIAEERAEAEAAARTALEDRAFGDAGATVVVEEFLAGREVSAFGIADGHDVVPIGFAQDFKRIGDGDEGPNTGGMGAYSPVPFLDDATAAAIVEGVLVATVRAMEIEGVPFRGALYAGLMLTDDGPKVLEFNARLGDPETQVVLPRLAVNAAALLRASAEGDLSGSAAEPAAEACVTVVLASGGYPGPYETGREIRGLDAAASVEGALVFHAGTRESRGRVVTAGGRVLSVGGTGRTLADARATAYEACDRVSFEGMQYRSDIAALAAKEGG
jgi:phosphoribosylamine--glycine ligase